MRIVNMIALTLLIVGGLNWGSFALFDFDIVAALFGGPDTVLATIVYCLVAASAIYTAFAAKPILMIENSHTHAKPALR